MRGHINTRLKFKILTKKICIKGEQSGSWSKGSHYLIIPIALWSLRDLEQLSSCKYTADYFKKIYSHGTTFLNGFLGARCWAPKTTQTKQRSIAFAVRGACTGDGDNSVGSMLPRMFSRSFGAQTFGWFDPDDKLVFLSTHVLESFLHFEPQTGYLEKL